MRKPDRFPPFMSAVLVSAAVVSALAFFIGGADPGVAQVYNGSTASGSNTVASDQNTFGGAVAPAQKYKSGQEPGYRGVMPGYVAPETPPTSDKPVAEEAPPKEQQRPMSTANTQPQMSYRPGYKPPHLPTADEIRQIAALAGVEMSLQTLPADLAQNVHIRHKVYGLVSGPQPRIDGMLPAEFTTKRTIDELMQRVNDQSLSDDDRKAAAGAAIQQLSNWGVYVRSRGAIPDNIYAAMGVPGVYVDESKEAMSKSDARLQDAITQLRDIQQQ